MTPRLEVDAEFRIDAAGDRIDVWSEPDRLVVSVPSFSAARDLLSATERLPVALEGLAGALEATDQPIELQIRRAPVVRFPVDGRRTQLVGDLLGVDADVEFRWRGVAAAAVRALG